MKIVRGSCYVLLVVFAAFVSVPTTHADSASSTAHLIVNTVPAATLAPTATRFFSTPAVLVSNSTATTPTANTIFSDNFDDNSIDTTQWTADGYNVIEQNGEMDVSTDVTDGGGQLTSRWIPINNTQPITITRRTLQHYGNNYYNGFFQLQFDTDNDGTPDIHFGVDYANNSYDDGSTFCARYGFFLDDGYNGRNGIFCGVHISAILPAIWDTWFNETLTYDPVSGLLSYSINGVPQTSLNVGSLPSSTHRLRLYNRAWGWWTGHYEHLDDFAVTQAPETQPPTITLKGNATTTVEYGSAYIDPGVTALDSIDGDISKNVIVTGVVDTTHIGTVTLLYTATDSAGLSATAIRTVIVQCTQNCYDNVMFLPGIEGSRLYEKDGTSDKELWVSFSDSKQSDMSLDTNGKSINSVYTKDDTQNTGESTETGIVDSAYGSNIYKSFIGDLRDWKSAGIIKDYAFIPYDWRLSLDDIITNGATSGNSDLAYTTSQDFSQSYFLKKLSELQASSPTGKVTIIAHSEGGLVAKAFIQKLKDTNNPLYNQIGKVILIAVPQVGTPEAMMGILHGDGIGPLGIVMSSARSRNLAKNMPSVYTLLPSAGYFTTVNTSLNPLATFENAAAFNSDIAQYGTTITSENEMKQYILGSDGRSDAPYDFVVNPAIGNPALYKNAQDTHQVLDSWTPASTTKVVQVAGWGEETLMGIDYEQLFNLWGLAITTLHPREVVDGDGTVVTPSALWISTSTSNVERWWVDLATYNKQLFGMDRAHADILEIPNLLSFIKSEIMGTSFSDPQNIVVNSTSRLITTGERLHFILHSPLTLGFTDSSGNYTGATATTTEFNIPGVDYKRFGEVQWLSVPKSMAGQVVMHGTGSGSFTLNVEQQAGNTIVSTTTFAAMPSATSTVATLMIDPSVDPTASSTLKIDYHGDGKVDSSYPAKQGRMVLPDLVPPEAIIDLSTSTQKIIITGTDDVSTTMVKSVAISTTITDEAGNWLTLMTKNVTQPNYVALTVPSFSYSNGSTTLATTTLRYFWLTDKVGKYTLLISAVKSQVDRQIAIYTSLTNKTYVVAAVPSDDTSDLSLQSALLLLRKQLKVYNGMYVPGVRTEKGRVLIQ